MPPTTKAQEPRKWERIDLPDFNGRKVFVTNGAFYSQIISLMASCGMERASTVKDADIVVFSGGADVNPALYGQESLRETSWSVDRDDAEIAVYNEAVELNKILFGICRGAQFIHVMNGGQLWQHVEGHGGTNHLITDVEDNYQVVSNSIHHQMLMENEDIEIVAVCSTQVSYKFLCDSMSEELFDNETMLEIEAGYYTDDRSFFVQGHPEVGSDAYRSWSMNKLYDHVLEWEVFDQEDLDDEEDLYTVSEEVN
jgi:gamma-glutamyl-gamma-aminobutyrate hydrolase PuuD